MELITLVLPTLHGGGAQRMSLNLAGEFATRGFRVHVVALERLGDRGADLRDDIPASVTLIELDKARAQQSLPAFVRYARRHRPHLLLAALPSANTVAAATKVVHGKGAVVILTERNSQSKALTATRSRNWIKFAHLMCRLTYPRADALVGVSEGVARLLAERFPSRRDRIHSIPNPAFPEEDPTAVGGPPHPWLRPGSDPCVVTVGRLVSQKDHETLVHAIHRARRHCNLRLLIVGQGPELPHIRSVIDELDLTDAVHCTGYRSDRLAFMRWADVFALSSRHEGFGNVLVEALAMETQVVSADCPYGPGEILDGGRFGRLVPPADPHALANALLRALEEPIDPALLRQRATCYSVDAIADRYLELYRACRESPK